jgi:hypothetical protein
VFECFVFLQRLGLLVVCWFLVCLALFSAPLRLQFVCWCLGLFVAKDFVVFRLGLCSRLIGV